MIPKIEPKVKKEVLPKRFSQKVYNRIFLGGLVGFVALSGLAIFAGTMRSLKPVEPVKVVESKNQPEDYRLQNYMNNFVYYYFTLSADPAEQVVQSEKLSSYYVEGLVSKNQGLVRQPMALKSYRLIGVTESVVTYLVSYTVTSKEGDQEQVKDVVTEFAIPYVKVNNQYYVSDFPYYLPVENMQYSNFKETDKFEFHGDNMSQGDSYKPLNDFVDLFFANYVSSQENLELISKGVTVLENTAFKSRDWSYIEEKDGSYIVYSQVTFVTAGVARSEHFTLDIVKKGDGYFIDQLNHGLVKTKDKKKE